jgi:hypothetical protein
MAWNSENGAWLFSEGVDREVLVRMTERRPYQAPCEKQQWPAPVIAAERLEACSLISSQDAERILGRPTHGEAVPGYFPEASGCTFMFNAADRAPHVLGARQVATAREDFARVAEFYLGSDGLSHASRTWPSSTCHSSGTRRRSCSARWSMPSPSRGTEP